MFSPDVAGPSTAASLRNPRRRQRNQNEDSIKLPKAKRHRSVLRSDTFTPLENVEVNAIAGQANGELSVNGHSTAQPPTPASTRQTRSSGNTGLQELAYRPPKKQDKRAERGDGGVTLSRNDFYAASQLPALPDQIRANGITSLNSVIAPEYGYALALTHTQAIIWPYTSSASSPPPKDIFTFTLPYPSRNASDPPPLGTFVSRSPSGQPGLVVIAPSSGKITYWEDISSAAIPGLGREKQNGFQGSAGLLSGEVVTTIENAEPAGFMLTFSSSRVAHLTVRDLQGKPSVNVEFLRDAGYRSSGGGLFGSVRNIFGGGGWRKDVAAVRAGRTRQRGQRDVVIATKTGTFELWDAFWSIGNSKRGQVDAKDALLQALKPTVTGDDSQNSFHFQVLDFAFGAEQKDKSELAIAGKNAPTPLVALVMLAEQMSVNYYLVEMTVDNDGADVEIVHPITCYKGLLEQRNSWKPRLVLPKPGNMAFVIFPTAIVLFSLVRVEESPSSQLAVETDSLPPPFQDCIDFRDKAYQVKGLGIEGQGADHKFSSCVLMVEGCGVIRVLTYPQREIEGIPQPAKVTAKSKLEQAVFFGTLNQNPIDFSAREEQQFTLQEINAAALEIQEEILKSASKFLPSVTPVLEHQLRLRAKALEDLAVYLRRQYPPLPRMTRWLLLAGAEKMAASRALWKIEEASTKTKADDEKTLLAMMLQYIHEHHKSLIDPSKGEHDQIRHWFTYDTGKVGIVIPWSFQVLKEAYRDGVKSESDLVTRICEANDILLATVDTAFKFRQTNASLYGLGDEDLTDGVLGSGYEGLPEFWTSSKPGPSQTRELLTTVQKTAATDFAKRKGDTPGPDMAYKLKRDAPRLVEIYSQMVDERSRWCIAQGSPKLRHEGEELRADQVSDRRQLMLEVGELGLVNEAIALAFKYKDMETLVELMNVTTGEIRHKLAQPDISKDDKEALETNLEYWHHEIASYFKTFGDDWAQAFFKRQIDDGLHGTLLYQSQFQSYLTRFFERNPGYEQLSWMNDVTGEGNYERASAHLNNLAVSEQSNVWRKKVELSLGRLAELALVEDKYKGDPARRVENAEKAVTPKAFKRQVALLDIQDLLYSHVQPAIGGAIDEAAEIQLVHEQFAEEIVKDLPALARLLKQGLTRLISNEVMSAEELIDVLTLMDVVYYGEDNESEVVGHEFYLALRCLDFGDLDSARKALLEKIIWRRCMIRDDWIAINKTVKKDDAQIEAETDATALFKTLREGYQNSFFPDPSLPVYEFRPLSPSATFNVGTDPDSFRSRFQDNDSKIRDALAEDMKKEDGLLKKNIDKGRLEKWHPGIVEAAKRAVREEADEKGAEMGQEAPEPVFRIEAERRGKGVKLVVHGTVDAGNGDVSMG